MHNNDLRNAITREVLAYYSEDDSDASRLTFDMLVSREADGWRIRHARKMLCLLLRDRAGMSIVEIAYYVERTMQNVDYHIKDIAVGVAAGDCYEWTRDIRNIRALLLRKGAYTDAITATRTPTPLYAGGRDRRGLRRTDPPGRTIGVEHE